MNIKCSSYIICKIHLFDKTSNENYLSLSEFFKNSVEVKRDILCSIDKKHYCIAGFDNKEKGDEAFSILKKSKYSIVFNVYYPVNTGKLLYSKEKTKLNNKIQEKVMTNSIDNRNIEIIASKANDFNSDNTNCNYYNNKANDIKSLQTKSHNILNDILKEINNININANSNNEYNNNNNNDNNNNNNNDNNNSNNNNNNNNNDNNNNNNNDNNNSNNNNNNNYVNNDNDNEIEDFNYNDFCNEKIDSNIKTSNEEIEDFNYEEYIQSLDNDFILRDESISLNEYIQKMALIRKRILNFLDKKECGRQDYDEFTQFINDQNIKKYLPQVKEVLKMIVFISKKHLPSSLFDEKIIHMISIVKDEISKYFTRREIFYFFIKNKKILLYLIKKKIFSFDTYISNIITEKYTYEKYHYYFFPEINSYIDIKTKIKLEKQISNIFDDINKFKICRDDKNLCPILFDIISELYDGFIIVDHKKEEEEDENEILQKISPRMISLIKNHKYNFFTNNFFTPETFFLFM